MAAESLTADMAALLQLLAKQVKNSFFTIFIRKNFSFDISAFRRVIQKGGRRSKL